MITVKDFLVHLPGPAALEGAVVVPGSVALVLCGERVYGEGNPLRLGPRDVPLHYTIVETPPLYRTGKERYCAWCKDRLFDHYSERTGVVKDAACPRHGYPVPVLHAPGPVKPLIAIDTETVKGWDLNERRKVSYKHLQDQWKADAARQAFINKMNLISTAFVQDHVKVAGVVPTPEQVESWVRNHVSMADWERFNPQAAAAMPQAPRDRTRKDPAAAVVTCGHTAGWAGYHCIGCGKHQRDVDRAGYKKELLDVAGDCRHPAATWNREMRECGTCGLTHEEIRWLLSNLLA